MPSVRGREQVVVAGVLVVSSAASGALFGFGSGVLALALGGGDTPAGEPAGWALATAAGAAAAVPVLDLAVPPMSVRRQVPQLWGRVLSARTTALLYGARLGVGPLTILRTWWWWIAALCAALAGVWVAVAVGALFGAARSGVMLAAGTRAGAWVRAERLATRGAVLVAVAAAVALGVTAFDGDAGAGDADATGSGGPRSAARVDAGEGSPRVDPDVGTTTSTSVARPTAGEVSLGAALPEELGDGYVRVDDDPAEGLGALDLEAAAGIESDGAAERSLLETRRFEAGWARAWRHADGRVAYAATYRFAEAAGAAAYLVDGFVTLEGRGARVYDIPEIPGGRGFSQASSEAGAGEVAHGVAFSRGDRFYLVVVSSLDSSADAGDALVVGLAVPASRSTG